MPRDRDNCWGDAVYEAWRRGLNSDLVDRDRMADDEARGATCEEAIARELRRIAPKPKLDEYEQFPEEYDDGE